MVDFTLQDKDFTLNKWKRLRTGFMPFIYSSLVKTQSGVKVVREHRVPRFTAYYCRYVSNMRTPTPALEYLTESAYESMWISEALLLADTIMLKENPSIDDVSSSSYLVFHKYGQFACLTPQESFDKEFGTRKTLWVAEVAKLLGTKKDSAEYHSIGDTLGETDEERATYLWSHFSEESPSSAIGEYFGIIKQITTSKLTKGVILKLYLPAFLKKTLNCTSIDVVSSNDLVSYKNGNLSIQYDDESHLIFPILEKWYMLSRTKGLPEEIYMGHCEIVGFNNVTHIQEARTIQNVFPRSVGKKMLELKY